MNARGISPSPNVYGMPRVHLGDHEAAPGAGLLNGGGEDVDFYSERDLARRGNDVWISTASTGRTVLNSRGTRDSRIGR